MPTEITPDTKDWTWVLNRACPDCGYDAAAEQPARLPERIRSNAETWTTLLGSGEVTRARPAADVWSPLEYACHVRDVLRLFDRRLTLMLTQDDPEFANWDQDETAVAERYGEQDPAAVSVELEAAAVTIARHFAGLDEQQWTRPGRRTGGSQFTVDTFARYLLHDLVHHVHDVSR